MCTYVCMCVYAYVCANFTIHGYVCMSMYWYALICVYVGNCMGMNIRMVRIRIQFYSIMS